MKIKTALFLLIGVGSLLALLGLIQIELSNQERQRWRQITRVTHELARSAADLESLAQEWILRPSPRPMQQWDLLRQRIKDLIGAIDSRGMGMASPRSMVIALDRADRLFRNLTKEHYGVLSQDRRSGIVDQLLVHIRELTLQADLYLSSSLNLQDRSAKRELFILYVGVALIGLAGYLMVLILRQRILRPLGDLVTATRSLGESLTCPPIPKLANDEFGALVDAFNEMTVRIGVLTRQIESQSARRAEDRLLHHFADSQPQPVWAADNAGLIQWKNQAFKDIFGTGYIGSLWTGLVHPDDLPSLDAILARADASSTNKGSTVECRLATLNGWRWFVVRTAPLETTSTDDHPWICTAGDIHGRRMMEERLRDTRLRTEALNRISADLAGELDLERLARAVAMAAQELLQGECAVFRLPPRDPSGEATVAVAPDPDGEDFRALADLPGDLVPVGARLTGEDLAAKDDGGAPALRRISSAVVVPLYTSGSGPKGHLIVAHRQSDAFDADDLGILISLARIASVSVENARLHAVERSAVRLADSRARQLERSNSDLQEFAYVASHDLQEPLRMITAYLDLVRDRGRNALDADTTRYLERTSDAALRMTRLVKDLLTYSRAGHDHQVAEPVDLGQVVDEVCEDLRARIEEVGGQVIAENLPQVWSRRLLIRQVLLNLIQNGLKYRHPERSPLIRVSATDTDTDLLIQVSDNGMGIPEPYQERIFRLFQRLSQGPAEGSGIGLSICRKLVRTWGGEITVESDGSSGTTFTFSIPLRNGASTPSASFPVLT